MIYDMRRGLVMVFVIICVYWTGIVFLNKFPPSEEEIQLRYLARSQATQIPVPANFAWEMPFPLPKLLLLAIPPQIVMSPDFFRTPNLIVGILTLAILWVILKEDPKLMGQALAIAAVTPWLIWIMISDFPAILTLLLALTTMGLAFKKSRLAWFTVGLTSLTSFSGVLFGLIFGIWYGLKTDNKINKTIILTTAGIITACLSIYLIRTNRMIPADLTSRVDQRVRLEFKLNNYQNIIPLRVKRFAYNKIYFGYRTLVSQVFSVFDLEKIAFPAETDATVARGMWNNKGLPWLLFWELLLTIWGIYHIKALSPKMKNLSGIFFGWGILGMFLGGNSFLGSGIGIVIPVAIISALALHYIPKALLFVGGIMVFIGLFATDYHFLANELYWRDNRPRVQTVMALMAVKYKADYVTTILGRSFLYYAWLNQMSPNELWQATANGNIFRNVKFDHFLLKNINTPVKKIYVGFPGEFLGDKKIENRNDFSPADLPANYHLLDSYLPRDTVSFGNGDEIWAVRVN